MYCVRSLDDRVSTPISLELVRVYLVPSIRSQRVRVPLHVLHVPSISSKHRRERLLVNLAQ